MIENPIERLTAIGTALYGPYFQSELAQALAVTPRTVRRWVAGDFNIPDGVWDEIRPLLQEREATLRKLRVDCRPRRPASRRTHDHPARSHR